MPEAAHADVDLGMGGLEKTAATPHDPTVVQFGSEICAHCPAATLLLSQLTADFRFSWVYQDCLSELAEEFQISKLPAIAVWGGDRATVMVYQGLRGDQVRDVVERHCARRLVLDADF